MVPQPQVARKAPKALGGICVEQCVGGASSSLFFYFLDVVVLLDENGEVASAFVGLDEKVEVASAVGPLLCVGAGHYY